YRATFHAAGARLRPRRKRRPRQRGNVYCHLACDRGPMTMSDTSRILVVEDDRHLAEGMAENMRAEGYDTDTAHDGRSGLEKAIGGDYDLLVLDVMLPQMDGFTLCKHLREQGRNTPVLFLTARGDPQDRIRGLEAGGDDYLTKPFHLEEFLLRVRAILKRWQWYKSATVGASPTD